MSKSGYRITIELMSSEEQGWTMSQTRQLIPFDEPRCIFRQAFEAESIWSIIQVVNRPESDVIHTSCCRKAVVAANAMAEAIATSVHNDKEIQRLLKECRKLKAALEKAKGSKKE